VRLQPFNLLLGNIELASHAGVDLARFCRVSTQIQHALLYHSSQLKVPAVPQAERQAVSLSLPRCPITRRWSRSWRSSTHRWWSAGYRCRAPCRRSAATAASQFRQTVFNR
jgi:hypothetical protein